MPARSAGQPVTSTAAPLPGLTRRLPPGYPARALLPGRPLIPPQTSPPGRFPVCHPPLRPSPPAGSLLLTGSPAGPLPGAARPQRLPPALQRRGAAVGRRRRWAAAGGAAGPCRRAAGNGRCRGRHLLGAGAGAASGCGVRPRL